MPEREAGAEELWGEIRAVLARPRCVTNSGNSSPSVLASRCALSASHCEPEPRPLLCLVDLQAANGSRPRWSSVRWSRGGSEIVRKAARKDTSCRAGSSSGLAPCFLVG